MLRHRPQPVQNHSAVHVDAWVSPPMTPPSPNARSLASSVPSTVIQELHATFSAVKVHFESQFRRIGREDAALNDFFEFCAQLRELFHHDLAGLEERGPHRLQYVDDEGDTVTVASTPELTEALVSQRPARSALKFDITVQLSNPEFFRFSAPIEEPYPVLQENHDEEFEIHPRTFGHHGHHHMRGHRHHPRFGGHHHRGPHGGFHHPPHHHGAVGHPHPHPHPHPHHPLLGHHHHHGHGFHHRGPHHPPHLHGGPHHHHPGGRHHPGRGFWGHHPHHEHPHAAPSSASSTDFEARRGWEQRWETQLNPRWGREETDEQAPAPQPTNNFASGWAHDVFSRADEMNYGTLRGDDDRSSTLNDAIRSVLSEDDIAVVKIDHDLHSPLSWPPRPATASPMKSDGNTFEGQSVASVPTVRTTNTDAFSNSFPTMLETFMQLRDRVMDGLDRVKELTEEGEEDGINTKDLCKMVLNDVRSDFRSAKSIAQLSSRLGYPDATAMETVHSAMAQRFHHARMSLKQKKHFKKPEDAEKKRELKKEKHQQRAAARMARFAEKQKEKEAKAEAKKEKKADKKGKQNKPNKEHKAEKKQDKAAKKMAKKAAKYGKHAEKNYEEIAEPVAADEATSSVQVTREVSIPTVPASPMTPPGALPLSTPVETEAQVGGYGYTDDFDSEDYDEDYASSVYAEAPEEQCEAPEETEEVVEESKGSAEVPVVPEPVVVDPFEESVARFMELGVGNEQLARRLLFKHGGSLEAAAHEWLFPSDQ